MGTDFLFISSILLFAAVSRGLLFALTRSEAHVGASYSVKAERIGRGYKIFAWGLLCLLLLAQTVSTFIDSFLNL